MYICMYVFACVLVYVSVYLYMFVAMYVCIVQCFNWFLMFFLHCSWSFQSTSSFTRIMVNRSNFRRFVRLCRLLFLVFCTASTTISVFISSSKWTQPPIRWPLHLHIVYFLLLLWSGWDKQHIFNQLVFISSAFASNSIHHQFPEIAIW